MALIAAMLFFPGALRGQVMGDIPNDKHAGFQENIIPPSPGAYQMARYADSPVSYSLGQVDISIPLYTVKSRELEVPISLTYNTGGIKVDEIPATVGLGWSLNAGGVITKNVVGHKDDNDSSTSAFVGIFSYDDVYNNQTTPGLGGDTYLIGILENRYDSFWDRYTYNYNGNTGSFIVKRMPGANPTLEIEKTSVSDDRIDLEYDSNGEISKFIITDAKGIKYHFQNIEYVEFKVVKGGDDIDPSQGDPSYTSSSSWYLTEIVSPDGTDRISFTYVGLEGDDGWKKSMLSHSVTYQSTSDTNFSWGERNVSKSVSYYVYHCLAIQSIEFNGNIVDFIYSDHLNTLPIDMGNRGTTFTALIPENHNWAKYLSSVTVTNMERNIVWSAELEQGYFGDNRLKLEELKIYGGTDTERPSDGYKFSYYDSTSSMYYFARDMAGYYNGATTNENLIPYEPTGARSANRSHYFPHAVKYSLSQVDGMLGSVTKYEYESNGTGNDIVGLRIKSIETYDGTKLVKKRRFSYAGKNSTRQLDNGIDTYSTYSAGMGSSSSGNESSKIYHLTIGSYPVLPGVSPESTKVFYEEVTEDIYDGISSETVRIKYTYDLSEVYYDYDDVMRYNPLVGSDLYRSNTGKYLKTSAPNADQHIPYSDISNYYKEKSLALTNLASKKYYKQTGGTFELIREEISGYKTFNRKNFMTGLFARNILTGYEKGGYSQTLKDQKTDCFYFDVMEEMNTTKMTESTTIDYNEGQPVKSSSTTYSYSDLEGVTTDPIANIQLESLQLKSKKVISDGDEYLYKYYYPSSPRGDAVGGLFDRNQIYTPLREDIVINGTDTSTTTTVYEYFTAGGKSIIKPETITTSLNGNVIQSFTVHNYDACGNPVYVTLNGDKNTCYIWGYNGTTLVAEIKNATYSDVTYALGSTTINNILNRTTLTAADYNALTGMKNNSRLKNAHITVYEHYPLVGIKSVTDPSGRKMVYEYDGSCRLRAIKEDLGNNNYNVIESYDYNLINTL